MTLMLMIFDKTFLLFLVKISKTKLTKLRMKAERIDAGLVYILWIIMNSIKKSD